MKKVLNILLILVFAFLLVSCKKPVDVKITNILITEDSVIDFYEDAIDLSQIKIRIIKSNGEEEIKEFSSEYLITDINSLVVGYNNIEAKYENFTFYFSINIKNADDLRFTYKTDALGLNYYITGYTGKDENIVLPTKYKNKKVVGVEPSAFLNNNIVKTVVIPSGYNYLGEAAFYNCKSLKSIYIPSTIKALDAYSLNSVHIILFEDKLENKEILDASWYDKNNSVIYENVDMNNLIVENNYQYLLDEEYVTIIGYIGSEENICIPSKFNNSDVKKIGSNAFYKNENLLTVEIPSSVEVLENSAFCSCENLTSITLSTNLKRIEKSVFGNCISLENIDLPNSLEFIGHNAFIQCSSIKKINIPSSVKEIDTYAFAWCMGLEEIYIPKSVVNMGQGVVYGCGKVTVNCEFAEKPATWHDDWNPNNRKVNWGK